MSHSSIVDILTDVDALKQEYDADGVKIYFKSIQDFTIKLIKDEKIIQAFRKGHDQFDKLL